MSETLTPKEFRVEGEQGFGGEFIECSAGRTMYRVLRENRQVRERRHQLRHPRYQAPELLATRPNELWSGDITKLKGPATWTFCYLSVILDVFLGV